MTSIPDFVANLDPEQLFNCKEIVDARVATLKNQEKVKLWVFVSEYGDRLYRSKFEDAVEDLMKAVSNGVVKDEPLHITYHLVYPEELNEWVD